MLRHPIRAAAFVVPLTCVVGAAGCASSTSDTTATTTTADSTASGRVEIVDYDFSPTTITVKVGESVSWADRDTSDHWVVSSPSSPSTFDLGRQSTGSTVNFTFGAPGSYPYFCKLHNYMKGTVVVS
jgi:plastocyanin